MIELAIATPEDILDVTLRLRPEDIDELEAGHDEMSAIQVVGLSVERSTKVWAVRVMGYPEVLVGVTETQNDPTVGMPWMVSTPVIREYPMGIARVLKQVTEEMYQLYPRLGNYAMLGNRVSVRFLEWLGFRFHGPVVYKGGRVFQLFTGIK